MKKNDTKKFLELLTDSLTEEDAVGVELKNKIIAEIVKEGWRPPIKQGKWLDEDKTFARCSICGAKKWGCVTPYCEMCGSRMRHYNGKPIDLD